MKKSFLFTLAVALMAFNVHANGTKADATTPSAAGGVSGGFEASGHAVTGAGWQHFKTRNAAQAVARDINDTVPGVIGGYLNTSGTEPRNNTSDVLRFFVDEVELDLAKTFGENIRFRTDLDFGSATLYSGPRFANLAGGNIFVEQAFATANIGLGNGIEFLIGRFNNPMGFESVDVSDNDTISRSTLYRSFRPHHFTGAKFYYAFSDALDWHLWASNNGFSIDDGDTLGLTTDIPAVGTRLAYKWGEEGKQSHIGFTGIGLGQDHAEPTKRSFTWVGDLDFNWWATDNFAVGGEGLYRQIDSQTAPNLNMKVMGALLNLHYDFSDVWDGTLKYAWSHDVNGYIGAGAVGGLEGVATIFGGARQSLTGADQVFHEFTVAGNYAIADGAKFRLEGGYTLNDPGGRGAGAAAVAASSNRHIYGFGGGFAYEF